VWLHVGYDIQFLAFGLVLDLGKPGYLGLHFGPVYIGVEWGFGGGDL